MQISQTAAATPLCLPVHAPPPTTSPISSPPLPVLSPRLPKMCMDLEEKGEHLVTASQVPSGCMYLPLPLLPDELSKYCV